MSNNELLRNESIGKLLLKYSIPAIIGMMVNGLYTVIDRIFIGNIPNVGSLAITGLGITMPISTIILAFGMLIGLGTTTNISIKLGQGKKEEAQKLIGNAMTLAIVIGAILTVVGLVFVDKILMAFGASNETLEYAKSFIQIILLGTIPNLFAFSLNHSIRADGSPKVSAGIMVTGCVTNIILDALFIFQFNMGIKGAAIATVMAQSLTAICTLIYYLGGKSNLKFDKKNLRIDKKLVLGVFAIGLSPFAMQLAACTVQVISNHVLKLYGGDLAIGAMTTISSVAMVFLMPIFGINQGAQPIIGFNYGAKQYDRVKKTYLASLTVATIVLCVGFLIVQTYPEGIVGLFNKDPKLMKITIDGIKIYMLMMPIIGISITGTNFMQSIGKAKVSMFLSLLRQVILLIPAILILPTIFKLQGIWMAQAVADFISTAVTATIVIRELRKYKVVKESEINIVDGELAIEKNTKN